MGPKHDVLGGGLAVTFGLALLLWLIPFHVSEDPGLRLPVSILPRIVAWLLIGLGTLQMAGGVLRLSATPGRAELLPDRSEAKMVLLVLVILALAVTGMSWAGYLIAAPLLMAALAWIHTPSAPLRIVLAALLGPGVIYVAVRFVFERMLP